MPAELVAERLGYGDGGALLLRTYRHRILAPFMPYLHAPPASF